MRAQMGHPTDERAGKARTKATSRSSRASAHLRVQIREQIQRTPPQAGAATLPDPVDRREKIPVSGAPTAGGLWRTWDGPVRHFPVLTMGCERCYDAATADGQAPASFSVRPPR